MLWTRRSQTGGAGRVLPPRQVGGHGCARPSPTENRFGRIRRSGPWGAAAALTPPHRSSRSAPRCWRPVCVFYNLTQMESHCPRSLGVWSLSLGGRRPRLRACASLSLVRQDFPAALVVGRAATWLPRERLRASGGAALPARGVRLRLPTAQDAEPLCVYERPSACLPSRSQNREVVGNTAGVASSPGTCVFSCVTRRVCVPGATRIVQKRPAFDARAHGPRFQPWKGWSPLSPADPLEKPRQDSDWPNVDHVTVPKPIPAAWGMGSSDWPELWHMGC